MTETRTTEIPRPTNEYVLFCRSATPFLDSGGLDEQAFRGHLRRMISAGLGIYVGAGGNGEGNTLTHGELRTLFEIAVDECRGQVQVGANPPEQYLAPSFIDLTRIAVSAGVDLVNVFGPAPVHNYRPTAREYGHYLDTVLEQVQHPVALAPNPNIGMGAAPEVIAELCRRYEQIRAVNLSGVTDDSYFVRLQDRLSRPVDIYVPVAGSMNTLAMGAAGLLNNKGQANIIPQTFRSYLNAVSLGDQEGAGRVYAQLRRFDHFLDSWPGNPRWIKMAMRVLNLPGGRGGVREPYLMPAADEVQRFRVGLLALGIPEIDELARLA
jgi:4-hydroxy-tetrahydrodipicolinate synthase